LNYCIAGTAGHIDHGKTALIKSLTGMDTDRLKEEKERGISIDLGFAYLDLDNGLRCGIIDVPGHERFVRNMVAGSVGIDIVMLVVAANEGVMPQTAEHVDILKFLGIEKGIIVITKTDLATDSQIKNTEEEITELVEGTFLENVPLMHFSAVTGRGRKELLEKINELGRNIKKRDEKAPVLMPVDRVFTISGFGTVVTGTLQKGTIKIGDNLEILPEKLEVRIRNIQVHNETAAVAYAGQRVAVNLTGVSKEDLRRGNWLAEKNVYTPARMIDVYFKLLPERSVNLKNRTRIRLHLGTDEIIGRISFLEEQSLEPGKSQIAQFILEKEVVPSYGDSFVVRSYSPVETIGGGKILGGASKKHKFKSKQIITYLDQLNKGKEGDRLEHEILQNPFQPYNKIKQKGEEDNLKRLIASGKILNIQNYLIHAKNLEEIEGEIRRILEEFHRINPLRIGATALEIKKLVPVKYKQNLTGKTLNEILDSMTLKEKLLVKKSRYGLKDFKIKLNKEQEKLKEALEKETERELFKPPSVNYIKENFGKNTELKNVMAYMIEQGLLVPVEENIFHIEAINKAEKLITEKLKRDGKITAAEARDILGTNRKYAIILLEYFDSKKLTRRNGDVRVLVK